MIKDIKEFVISPIRESLRFRSCNRCGIMFPCKTCNDKINKIDNELHTNYRKKAYGEKHG